jgi:hypothetical protein
MTQTSDVPVEIDQEIRSNPQLLRAVELATRYFLEEYRNLPSDVEWKEPRMIWVMSPDNPDQVRPIFSERHPDWESRGGSVHSLDIPFNQIIDEYGRGVGVRRLLRSVIQGRVKVSSDRIDRWLIELEREEIGHG